MAILKAAINGNRSHADNTMVPITTMEIVETAVQCVTEGADAIHFHVRSTNGCDSLQDRYVAAQVLALRKAIPKIPVGISTGQWIESDINKRKDAILSWQILPDFVSLNFFIRPGLGRLSSYWSFANLSTWLNNQETNPYVFDETGYDRMVDMDLNIPS